MDENTEIPLRPDAFKTIVFGGLIVGVLDLIDAVTFYWFYANVPPIRIFQSIASGLVGREASREGGWNMAILGIFLHFIIATLIAVVFYLASLKLPVLIRKAVPLGMVYGVVCYFVMQYVVLPLSNFPKGGSFTWGPFINGIVGHALLVGLPVALIARWSVKKSSS